MTLMITIASGVEMRFSGLRTNFTCKVHIPTQSACNRVTPGRGPDGSAEWPFPWLTLAGAEGTRHMDRVQGDRESRVEEGGPSSSPAKALKPKSIPKDDIDPPRTKHPADDANAGACAVAAAATAATGTTAEQYPSHIRRKNTGLGGDDDGGGERDTEKGYVGGDRVRLLVGRYVVELTVLLQECGD